MSEWKNFKLVELAEVHNEKRVPLSKMERLNIQGEYPYYGASGIVDYINDYKFDGEFVLISEDGENLKTRKTPIAFKASGKFWVNNHAHIIKGKKDYLNDLLIYFFANLDLNQYITGAVQPKLSKSSLLDIPIYLPKCEDEQKSITKVLSSLDDKINLLQRQNKILDELAQILFRQYFIEEAKDDWEEYEVKDFVTHKKISIKPAQNPDDKFLHFSLPAFDTNKEPNIELGSDIKSNKYQVEPFSILMSKLNPHTPRVWDIYFEPKDNSICSTEFQVMQPNEKEFFPFISTLLKSDPVTGDLAMSASGTSGSHQRIKPEDILNISFVIPSIDKIKEFSELLKPNYLKQNQNQNQIQTLEDMKNTLLPKLMNGEVKVSY